MTVAGVFLASWGWPRPRIAGLVGGGLSGPASARSPRTSELLRLACRFHARQSPGAGLCRWGLVLWCRRSSRGPRRGAGGRARVSVGLVAVGPVAVGPVAVGPVAVGAQPVRAQSPGANGALDRGGVSGRVRAHAAARGGGAGRRRGERGCLTAESCSARFLRSVLRPNRGGTGVSSGVPGSPGSPRDDASSAILSKRRTTVASQPMRVRPPCRRDAHGAVVGRRESPLRGSPPSVSCAATQIPTSVIRWSALGSR